MEETERRQKKKKKREGWGLERNEWPGRKNNETRSWMKICPRIKRRSPVPDSSLKSQNYESLKQKNSRRYKSQIYCSYSYNPPLLQNWSRQEGVLRESQLSFHTASKVSNIISEGWRVIPLLRWGVCVCVCVCVCYLMETHWGHSEFYVGTGLQQFFFFLCLTIGSEWWRFLGMLDGSEGFTQDLYIK